MKKITISMAIGLLSGHLGAAVLEEVVVTAQKREQSAQDVGIAVSAFTGDQMSQLGWDSSDDVVSQTPGVTLVQPNGPSSFYVNIRGVAQNDFSGDNQESPVAVYVDDVYVASPTGASFQLFDFERVEVLRGPQGTLFGRNATGGLVHYVTKKPSQESEGYFQVLAGKHNQRDVEGAVGGAISETVSGRLSFTSNQHDPYIKNLTGKDLNDNDVWAIRGQVLFEFEDAELLLNARAGELDNSNGPFEHKAARPNAQGLGEIFDGDDLAGSGDSLVPNYSDPDSSPHEGSYNDHGFIKIETEGYTATYKMGLDDMEFVSITDYNTLERNYFEDSDAGPEHFYNFTLISDMEQFSQEFRLSGEAEGMNWVVGAYYMKYEGDLVIGGTAANFFGAAFPGFGLEEIPGVGLYSPFSIETESTAFFGQVEFDLTDNLVLTAGLRWSIEEKQTDFAQYYADFGSPDSNEVVALDPLGIGGAAWTFGPGGVSNSPGGVNFGFDSVSGDPSDSEIDDEFATWKLGLDWNVSDETLVYASYNRGVKAGGFNAPLDATLFIDGSIDPSQMKFDKEVLDAYEVGFKATIWDGLARLNGAAYFYDYQDYQAFALDGLTTYVFNTDAKNQGFELELQASPAEGWDVLLGMSYIDTEVEDAYTTPQGDLLDREMIMTPELTFNGLVRYEWAVGSGTVAAQYDFNYMNDHYFQLKNAPIGQEDAYTLSNVRLTYTSGEGDWLVSAFVNNVTDEEHRLMVFDLSSAPDAGGFGMAEEFYGKPRWWGVSLKYNW